MRDVITACNEFDHFLSVIAAFCTMFRNRHSRVL